MVSEATNSLFAGIISGWLVIVTYPALKWVVEKLNKKCDLPKSILYFFLSLIWLLAMMAFVLKVYG